MVEHEICIAKSYVRFPDAIHAIFLKAINPFQHGMFLIYDIDIKMSFCMMYKCFYINL